MENTIIDIVGARDTKVHTPLSGPDEEELCGSGLFRRGPLSSISFTKRVI